MLADRCYEQRQIKLMVCRRYWSVKHGLEVTGVKVGGDKQWTSPLFLTESLKAVLDVELVYKVRSATLVTPRLVFPSHKAFDTFAAEFTDERRWVCKQQISRRYEDPAYSLKFQLAVLKSIYRKPMLNLLAGLNRTIEVESIPQCLDFLNRLLPDRVRLQFDCGLKRRWLRSSKSPGFEAATAIFAVKLERVFPGRIRPLTVVMSETDGRISIYDVLERSRQLAAGL